MVLPIANQRPETDSRVSVTKEERPGNGSSFAETLTDARSSMAVEQDELIEDTDSEIGNAEEEGMTVIIPPHMTLSPGLLDISHETPEENVTDPMAQTEESTSVSGAYLTEFESRTSQFEHGISEEFRVSAMTDQVISILEGNKETDPLSDQLVLSTQGWVPADTHESAAKDLVARMPQIATNENAEITEIRTGVLIENKSDDLCPLENVNDKISNLTDGLSVGGVAAGAEDKESVEQNIKPDSETPINDMQIQHSRPMDIGPERLAAEQEFELAVPEAHAPENLFEVMVEKIELLKNDSTDRLEIQLKPEHLGKVTIQLTSGDDGMVVRIRAADYEVKNLIMSQIDRLLENLDNKGIKIADVDVVYSGIADTDQNQNRREASEDGNGRGNSRRLPVIGPLENRGTPMLVWEEFDASDMDLTISSVEYRV